MKTIIAGSRDISEITHVEMAIYQANRQGIKITEVVCGMARGVDALGFQWARLNGIPIKEFPANWNKWPRQAGLIRNKAMAEYAEALIAVWDGKSKGTHNMIARASVVGLKVFVYTV